MRERDPSSAPHTDVSVKTLYELFPLAQMSAQATHLINYAADVERYFDQESTTIISNKDREHAAVLISALFKRASSEIVIFSRKLDSDFYSRQNLECNLKEAFERGVNVKILVQEEPPADGQFLQRIVAEARTNNRVKIYRCKPESRGAKSPVNFTVVDRKSYRLEKDRLTHEAYACANDPQTAQKLIDLFQSFDQEHEELGLEKNL